MRVIVETPEQSAAASTDAGAVKRGHFSSFRPMTRANFASPEEVEAHVLGLREDWERS